MSILEFLYRAFETDVSFHVTVTIKRQTHELCAVVDLLEEGVSREVSSAEAWSSKWRGWIAHVPSGSKQLY